MSAKGSLYFHSEFENSSELLESSRGARTILNLLDEGATDEKVSDTFCVNIDYRSRHGNACGFSTGQKT